jgi:hypothetical protein
MDIPSIAAGPRLLSKVLQSSPSTPTNPASQSHFSFNSILANYATSVKQLQQPLAGAATHIFSDVKLTLKVYDNPTPPSGGKNQVARNEFMNAHFQALQTFASTYRDRGLIIFILPDQRSDNQDGVVGGGVWFFNQLQRHLLVGCGGINPLPRLVKTPSVQSAIALISELIGNETQTKLDKQWEVLYKMGVQPNIATEGVSARWREGAAMVVRVALGLAGAGDDAKKIAFVVESWKAWKASGLKRGGPISDFEDLLNFVLVNKAMFCEKFGEGGGRFSGSRMLLE